MNDIPVIVQAGFPDVTVRAGFTTRLGGLSRPPYDTLNLGLSTGDDPAVVRQNRRRLYAHLAIYESTTAVMQQVHGTVVRTVSHGGVWSDTDGLITGAPGVLLAISTADCVPLLLADTRVRAVGAIHCGWRPLVGGIVGNAVAGMQDAFGSKPENITAVLGPAAASCCYEIGEDVAMKLQPSSVVKRGGSLYGDLYAECRSRLVDTGVPASSVKTVGECTVCNPQKYYSHRRDGALSGRMNGFIMIVRPDNPVTTDTPARNIQS